MNKKSINTKLENGQLTVSELIKKLMQMPQNAPVWYECYDSYGYARNVILDIDNTVVITEKKLK